jgi:hypothetical protein
MLYPPPSLRKPHDHNPATRPPHWRPILACQSWRDANQTETECVMTEQEERLAHERAEIAERVASFRETQRKFAREREEYYATTLGNAWSGFARPPFWT